MTLLQIYESYENGQLAQFAQQVRTYGASDFARDIGVDTDSDGDWIFTDFERYTMLKLYIAMTE